MVVGGRRRIDEDEMCVCVCVVEWIGFVEYRRASVLCLGLGTIFFDNIFLCLSSESCPRELLGMSVHFGAVVNPGILICLPILW